MKRFTVITSIFAPTEAVKRYAALSNTQVIVVGDKKSPADFCCEGVEFISWQAQQAGPFGLDRVIPYNHYCRKMLGYLAAIRDGATQIVDTDDDNIPLPNYNFPAFADVYPVLPPSLGFVNIYELYSRAKIWPRGLPLRLITTETLKGAVSEKSHVTVGIWQGLANDDPDVDAIYRLTDGSPCTFEDYGNVVLGRGTMTPFNSQNTCYDARFFPLLYLPTTVTFRFTDILRGFVAQPILWAAGATLGFTNATVVQERNPHDYTRDFESEVPMYLQGEKAFEICAAAVGPDFGVEENLTRSYRALCDAGIVRSEELTSLQTWLDDIRNVRG